MVYYVVMLLCCYVVMLLCCYVVMLCYVMLCYVMLCYVMLCYAMCIAITGNHPIIILITSIIIFQY